MNTEDTLLAEMPAEPVGRYLCSPVTVGLVEILLLPYGRSVYTKGEIAT